MEVWKIIFRSKWVISRFQPLIFQGVVPGIYLDSPWPVRVPKKSLFGLIRTFYSPPFSAGYVYVHVYVCVCTYIYIYIHTYIYISLIFSPLFYPTNQRGAKTKTANKQRLHEGEFQSLLRQQFLFSLDFLEDLFFPPERRRLQRRCLDFLDWRKKNKKLWNQWHGIYHINDMVCFFHTLTYFINIWHMYFFFIVARDLPYHLIINWCRIFLRY